MSNSASRVVVHSIIGYIMASLMLGLLSLIELYAHATSFKANPASRSPCSYRAYKWGLL